MPNSILWTGLVALWLFVLFPMLAGRHPRIRQTTDAALATRVLHRGGVKRGEQGQRGRGYAMKYDRDPQWDRAEDWMADDTDIDETTDGEARSRLLPAQRERSETHYIPPEFVPDRRGRGGFDPEADALASASRYAFRQRMVLLLALLALAGGVLGFVVTVAWLCSGLAVFTLLGYLGYLRKQVRMEAEIRRRRLARLGRGDTDRLESDQIGTDSVPEPVDPAATVVLEADDDDPVFYHLDTYTPRITHTERPDQDMRPAVGE